MWLNDMIMTAWIDSSFLLKSTRSLASQLLDQGVVNRSSEPGADGFLPKVPWMQKWISGSPRASLNKDQCGIMPSDFLRVQRDPYIQCLPGKSKQWTTCFFSKGEVLFVEAPMVSQLASMAPEVQVADAETAAALVLAACHSLAWLPTALEKWWEFLLDFLGHGQSNMTAFCLINNTLT